MATSGPATAPRRAKWGAADEDGEVDERRVQQRQKQINFGYNTDGYTNMIRLVKSDPRLKNGGVLPLEPPPADMKATKRTWDVLIRKWRRALHMFDHAFIDEEDAERTTLADVVEKQRLGWLNDAFKDHSKSARVSYGADDLLALRDAPNVPTKIPAEDALIPILRSLDHYERSVTEVVHETSPQHAATLARVRHTASISPTNCGIKVRVSPDGNAAMCPSQLRSTSPPQPSTVPRSTPTTPIAATDDTPIRLDTRFAAVASATQSQASSKRRSRRGKPT